MKPSTYEKVRYAIALVVATCAGILTNQMIKNNAIPKNTLARVVLSIGAFAISGIVGDAAKQWAIKTVDEYYASYLEIRAVIPA